MSTSSYRTPIGAVGSGFTALELLLGITLTVLLALGTAPLVLSLQAVGVRETDRTVSMLQGRVAAARMERDLRLASASGSLFAVHGPILEATPSQIVFLGPTAGVAGTGLIEWEIAGSSLMRRWGSCPLVRPASFGHSLYADHKTMLGGLAGGTQLTYLVNGRLVTNRVLEADLPCVEAVMLSGDGRDSSGEWPWGISIVARVGL